jgi:serine/threonine protein phosphatase PrpC
MHSASPYPEPDVPRRHRTPDEPAITRVRDSAGESRRGRHGVPGGGGGRRALIGILAEPRLVARTISLRAGDTLILSSDGLTEARTGTGRYGDEALRDFVQDLGPVGAAPVVETHAGLLTTFDDVDVAVVALTVKG